MRTLVLLKLMKFLKGMEFLQQVLLARLLILMIASTARLGVAQSKLGVGVAEVAGRIF